ncbi:MAG: hypothetical protein KGZ82_12855 [Bacteroidales bacterium]|nr:hypothetical protein [Bacteroidales bacterium]
MKKKLTISLLTCFMLVTGLLLRQEIRAQRVDCFVIKAPVKQYDNVRKIGVLDFTGNRRAGSVLSDYIIADLLSESRGIEDLKSGFMGMGKKVEGVTYIKGFKTDMYTVVERSQIEQVLKEQRIGLSGLIDENTAAQVGKLLGLDVILIGDVEYDVKNEYPSSNYVGFDGKSKTTYCHVRSVTVQASLKIISVETAIIIGTETSRVSSQDKKCDEEKSSIATEEQLLNSCLKKSARTFVDYFTPGFQLMRYDLERIKLKELKKQADEASNFIENGNIDRALPLFYAIYEADSYNPKAAYNLAALYEMVGSFDEALEYYTIASNLEPANTLYTDGLHRAKSGVAIAGFLESIGRPLQKYEFNASTADLMAKRIKIKGKSSDRVEVRDLPVKNGKVIARVPGGLEFPMIEQKGEWFRIKLPDGKEGFVHRSDVN